MDKQTWLKKLGSVRELLPWIVPPMVVIFVLAALFAHTYFKLLGFETAVELSLVLIAGYFVYESVFRLLERTEFMEKTSNRLDDLIKSVGVMKIIESSEEYYRALKGAMEAAKDSVLLLYLTPQTPPNLGKEAQDYWKWFVNFAARRGGKITIKRIAALNSAEKSHWIIENTKKLGRVELYGLKCFSPQEHFPLLGLEIIDRREIFLFGPHSQTSTWVYSKNENVGHGIAAYFNALWDKLGSQSTIKEVGEIITDLDVIAQKIENILKGQP